MHYVLESGKYFGEKVSQEGGQSGALGTSFAILNRVVIENVGFLARTWRRWGFSPENSGIEGPQMEAALSPVILCFLHCVQE